MKIVNCNSKLTGYIHEDLTPFCETYLNRPVVIVCPGGAYMHLSPREKDPVVFPLFSAGYQVFVLEYSIGDAIKGSEPEEELASSVAYIKNHHEELNVISDQIAVLGFSAGGHLAASLCCHWPKYGEESHPDCGILCYPVITMGEYKNERTTDTLCYGDSDRLEYFSLENQVTDKTSPCFIWHTTEDTSVPIQNSLLFVTSLVQHKIPFEYHVFEKGKHGLSLGRRETGPEEVYVQDWFNLAVSWLNRRWDFVL